MNSIFKFSYILLISLMFILGCKKKTPSNQPEIDDNIIKTYLTNQGITAIKTSSGLYYQIQSQGPGLGCNANSTVKVYYKGYLTDGSVFDESSTLGISFNLQNVIQGWTEGIPYFKEGGIGKLFIPSALAYGSTSKPGIPKNSVLIFDIKLIDVQ